jgi:hypothetical protein
MLHEHDGRITIAPGPCELLTTQAVGSAVMKTSTRPHISAGDPALVYEAVKGARSAKSQRATVNGVLRTGRLRNAGLVCDPGKETQPMVVSEDVRFSLMLDDVTADSEERHGEP